MNVREREKTFSAKELDQGERKVVATALQKVLMRLCTVVVVVTHLPRRLEAG